MLLKKKIHNYITNDVEISSHSDEEISDEEILEKIQAKKKSDKEDSSKEDSSEEDSSEDDSSEEDSDDKKIDFFYTHKYYQKLPDYWRNYYLPHKK